MAGNAVDIAVFTKRYLAHASLDLPAHTEESLQSLADNALELGLRRTANQTLLNVADIDARTTAIDIVTTDVTYLVDSLRAELARIGRRSARALHPQLVVTRDADGVLTEVHDLDDTAELPAGAIVESWMHVEVDLLPESKRISLTADLERVIADVQFAFADRHSMRAWLTRWPISSPKIRANSIAVLVLRPASCCAGWPMTTIWSWATRPIRLTTSPTRWPARRRQRPRAYCVVRQAFLRWS